MTKGSRNRNKVALALAIGLVITPGITACQQLSESGTYDREAEYEFRSIGDKDAKTILPAWVPHSAKYIKEVQRTTGNERILTFRTSEQLPQTCIRLPTQGKPDQDLRIKGLAVEHKSAGKELEEMASNQHLEPLIDARWWPDGQEDRTTHLCGKWWVSRTSNDTVYAFTPETKPVAEGVLAERANSD